MKAAGGAHHHLEHFLCVWVHLDELLVQSRNLEDEIHNNKLSELSSLTFHPSEIKVG